VVLQCVQRTNIALSQCMSLHTALSESRDARVFDELVSCQQQHDCLPAVDDHNALPPLPLALTTSTGTAINSLLSSTGAASTAAASTATDNPQVVYLPPPPPPPEAARFTIPTEPNDCDRTCAVECNNRLEDLSSNSVPCITACTLSCFQKRYVVSL